MTSIPPKVQQMIDNPGIYICTTENLPAENFHERAVVISAIVIFSVAGKLIVLERDKELDPTRFAPDLKISHGPLWP